MKYEKTPEQTEAHKHSSRNQEEIAKSEICGCFYCCQTYPATEVVEWIDRRNNPRIVGDPEKVKSKPGTALCPKCHIDSVIGDAAGFDLTPYFLDEMHKVWFGYE